MTTTVKELNELAKKMTGVNPKARTDQQALDYIERNYTGGTSQAIILDLDGENISGTASPIQNQETISTLNTIKQSMISGEQPPTLLIKNYEYYQSLTSAGASEYYFQLQFGNYWIMEMEDWESDPPEKKMMIWNNGDPYINPVTLLADDLTFTTTEQTIDEEEEQSLISQLEDLAYSVTQGKTPLIYVSNEGVRNVCYKVGYSVDGLSIEFGDGYSIYGMNQVYKYKKSS